MHFCQKSCLNSRRAGRCGCILLALTLYAQAGLAEDGYWVNSSGGSWSSAGNWDPINGIASGADSTAYFGLNTEATLPSSCSFTLNGTQTIGNLCFTTQHGPASWSFGAGTGGSLVMDSTFGLPQITVTSPSLQVSLNAVIAGDGVQKDGPGTLILSANNTYTGKTVVNAGGLNVTGSIASGGVNVFNAALSGSGTINGPVVIGSGGTFSPANMTINNSLVLQPGSTTSISLNGHPVVQGLTSVTYGGTLIVNNSGGPLSLGQSFPIFGSVAATGNFTSIQPNPGPWMRWSINPATGEITVVSSASPPSFASVGAAGNNLILHVTDGPPGSTGYLLTTTDLSLPKSEWRRVGTNNFDMSGSFTCTNAAGSGASGQLYMAVMVVATP